MPTQKSVCADYLEEWLGMRHDPVLPRMADIAKLLPTTVVNRARHWAPGEVADAFTILQNRRVITMQHGTRSEHRGHYAVRLLSTGFVMKTAGCPFADPPDPRADKRQPEKEVVA